MVGLVAREYEVVNRPVMDVYDAAFALGLKQFYWDRALSVVLEFRTEGSLMAFVFGYDGISLPPISKETPVSMIIRIDAAHRDLAEAVIEQLGLAENVDVIERVRVVLAANSDHKRLFEALRQRSARTCAATP